MSEADLTDDALRVSRELLSAIINSSEDAIVSKTLDGVVTSWNPAAERIFGYTAAEMIGRPIGLLAPPGREHETSAMIERIRRGERVQRYETVRRRKDGALVDVSLTLSPVRDATGRIIGASKLVRDVTSEKRVRDELRLATSHLARAQRVGRLGSAEIAMPSGRVYWSDECYRLLGLDPSCDRPGVDSFLKVILPEDREWARDLAARMRTGEDVDPVEFRIRRPDGTMAWLLRTVEILRDETGAGFTVMMTLQDVTERRQFDERLRRNEQHMARVQRIGGIGSTEVDLTTGEAHWSDEIFHMLGIERGEVKPGVDSFAEFIHPDDRAMMREVSLRGRRGEEVEPCEYRMVGPDGKVRWFLRQAEFIREGGRPVRLVATMYDITRIKNAEQELRRNREHLSMAQRVAGIGSIAIDLRANEVAWSDHVYDLLGFERGSVSPGSAPLYRIVHPDDLDMVRQRVKQMMQGEDVAPFEYRVVLPDGRMRWLRRQQELIGDDAGNPVKAIVTLLDITERKRIEERMRLGEEHLALAQRVGAIGSTDVDYASGAIVWSDELYRILGRDRDTTPPTREAFLDCVHPDDRAAWKEASDRKWEGGTMPSIELRIVRPDGEIRWLRRQHGIVQDAEGNPRRSIATLQDITEVKLAEQRRQDLEAQLAQAQKMEALGQLTGGIAHDFNNILGVVIGNLDLLGAELPEGTEEKELVDTAIEACLKGNELTKSLLAFSRRQPLKPRVIQLNDLLDVSLKMLNRAIGETIEVRVRPGDGLWPVLIDPSLLETSLLNLMVNARDAMPGGGTVRVATRNVHLDESSVEGHADLAPGDYVLLEVGDTGSGMPPEVLARVFEPFFTTKEKGKGTGLGLAMVFGFVKQSGGHITIYSEVGKGTVVRIYLPRAAGVVGAARAGSPAVADTGARGETILAVDDNTSMRQAVVRQLGAIGYRVVEADSATAALDVLRRGAAIDLVFSDVVMPGEMGGAELALRVKAEFPGVKVLLTSGFPQGLVESGGAIPAGTVLLAKPYRMADLALKLREVLDS